MYLKQTHAFLVRLASALDTPKLSARLLSQQQQMLHRQLDSFEPIHRSKHFLQSKLRPAYFLGRYLVINQWTHLPFGRHYHVAVTMPSLDACTNALGLEQAGCPLVVEVTYNPHRPGDA